MTPATDSAWVVVPRRASTEMLTAAWEVVHRFWRSPLRQKDKPGPGFAEAWEAMLAARPPIPDLTNEEAEAMARAYERVIFKHEWEDDDQWTPGHTADAIAALRAAWAAWVGMRT